MNDIEKQEIEPAAHEQAESTEKTVKADSSQNPPKASQKVAIFALVLALTGSVIGYLKLDELNNALQQERQLLSELKEQQQEAKGHLDRSDQALSAQQTAIKEQDEWLKRQTEEMNQSLELVYERVGRSSTQWLVAEAEYLMRIANHRLQLEGDNITALVALQRADKRLLDSGDPAWTAVREKLASEMVELKGIKDLDLAGQAAKLSGLISQVDKLKLPHSVSVASEESEAVAEEKEFNFDRVLEDFWGGLKSLLKVRRSDRPVTTMLEPDDTFFLYQNLRLQLEGARLALLRRDQTLFDASLQRGEAWIKEFFDQEHALTKSMLDGVNELAKLELEAKMPDISGSLRMLLEQQGRGGEAPKPADEAPKQAEEAPKSVGEKRQQVEQELKQLEEEPRPAEEGQRALDEEQSVVSEESKPVEGVQEKTEEEQKPVGAKQKEAP